MDSVPSFAALGVSSALVRTLESMGLVTPMPVQVAAIPAGLAGADLLARSATGSGKTIAFGVALLERLDVASREPQALVLCPTRDLCDQVAAELRLLGRFLPHLSIKVLAGGRPIALQLRALEGGVHLLVATPGRLLDHLRRGSVDPTRLRMLVLDEADRMLDLGFREDIEEVLRQIPKERQTLLFSATFPPEILAISGRYQHDPQRVAIEDAVPQLVQWRCEVSEPMRLPTLAGALQQPGRVPALVFCNTKQTVEQVARALAEEGHAAGYLHGGLTQPERDLMLARFRNRSLNVLVATDVAARGIDVSGLMAVVNYELPFEPETYVHRIGRTARAGAEGMALSLHGVAEARRLAAIEALSGPIGEWPHEGPVGKRPPAAPMRTLIVAGGRKQKLRAGDILGALAAEAGLARDEVGRIEVADTLCYVAVRADLAVPALKALRAGRIKGRRFPVHLPG
jgi:ATP-dependent RNA helicase DbpA